MGKYQTVISFKLSFWLFSKETLYKKEIFFSLPNETEEEGKPNNFSET